MSDIPGWHIVGDWFDNCSCAVACPCTFAQAPDNGFCESVLFWHVREGHYGDVKLDNLSFVRVGRWEGDLWARQATGVAGFYIDEHADDRQMEALPAIIGGRAGGFPGWVNECFSGGRQARGVERAKITFEIAPDQAHWGVEIAGKVKAWANALFGPTSAPGQYPRLMGLPRDWGSGCGGHWRGRVIGGVETLPEAGAERAVVDGAADLEQPVGATP